MLLPKNTRVFNGDFGYLPKPQTISLKSRTKLTGKPPVDERIHRLERKLKRTRKALRHMKRSFTKMIRTNEYLFSGDSNLPKFRPGPRAVVDAFKRFEKLPLVQAFDALDPLESTVEQLGLDTFDTLVSREPEHGAAPGPLPETKPSAKQKVKEKIGVKEWDHAAEDNWDHFNSTLPAFKPADGLLRVDRSGITEAHDVRKDDLRNIAKTYDPTLQNATKPKDTEYGAYGQTSVPPGAGIAHTIAEDIERAYDVFKDAFHMRIPGQNYNSETETHTGETTGNTEQQPPPSDHGGSAVL